MTWNRWKIDQMPLILARHYLKVLYLSLFLSREFTYRLSCANLQNRFFKVTKQAEILQTKVNSSLLDLSVNDEVSLVLSKWIDEVRLIPKGINDIDIVQYD